MSNWDRRYFYDKENTDMKSKFTVLVTFFVLLKYIIASAFNVMQRQFYILYVGLSWPNLVVLLWIQDSFFSFSTLICRKERTRNGNVKCVTVKELVSICNKFLLFPTTVLMFRMEQLLAQLVKVIKSETTVQ